MPQKNKTPDLRNDRGLRLLANRNWVRGGYGYPAGLEKYGERLERLPGCGALPV